MEVGVRGQMLLCLCLISGTGTEINPHFWKPGDKNWCQGGESSRNSPCDSAAVASSKRNWRRCPRCCYKKEGMNGLAF